MLLNCDMGESFGNYTIGADSEVMPSIDMANIACGMHASDPDVMSATVALAAMHGVTVGAHPGYPDLQGFGRRQMALSAAEVKNSVLYQIGALSAFCRLHEVPLAYIKPHGALYHAMMGNEDIMDALLDAARIYEVQLMILATTDWQKHKQHAEKYHVELLLEGFVDRGYEDDGRLVQRGNPGAMLSQEQMIKRVQDLSTGKPVCSINGVELLVPVDTLCVHGDGKGVALVRQFRTIINAHG